MFQYLQLFKSYDILWLWIHLPLCLCSEALRKDNLFVSAVKLLVGKKRAPTQSCSKLFSHLWRKEEEETESSKEEEEKSNLPAAVSLAIFYLRLAVSIALVIGRVQLATQVPCPLVSSSYTPTTEGALAKAVQP